jgi:hypothetical protein
LGVQDIVAYLDPIDSEEAVDKNKSNGWYMFFLYIRIGKKIGERRTNSIPTNGVSQVVVDYDMR